MILIASGDKQERYTMTDPVPQGVYIRHAFPGDTIEIVVWRSGEAPIIRKINDKKAIDLATELTSAVRSNWK